MCCETEFRFFCICYEYMKVDEIEISRKVRKLES